MNSFGRINNKFINDANDESIMPVVQKPVKNTLFTRKSRAHKKLYGGDIFEQVGICSLTKENNNLSQIKCKINLTVAAAHVSELAVEPYLATRIFKELSLKTKSGVELQRMIPEYTTMRIDEISGTPLHSRVARGLEPSTEFVAAAPVSAVTTSLYLPLFFFFSDSVTNFLQTISMEEVFIHYRTNDDATAFGITSATAFTISAMDFEFIAEYHDTTESSVKYELDFLKNPTVKKIVNSYNIFEEDSVTLVSGQTTAKLLLRCPFPLYATHYSIISNTGKRVRINTIKKRIGNEQQISFDSYFNYKMYAKQNKAYAEDEAFSEWMNIYQNRDQLSGLITYSGSDNMNPTNLEITFEAIPATLTWKLLVFSEYCTEFNIDENGIVEYVETGGKLRYPQSYVV
jgi:hypothetical protein